MILLISCLKLQLQHSLCIDYSVLPISVDLLVHFRFLIDWSDLNFLNILHKFLRFSFSNSYIPAYGK